MFAMNRLQWRSWLSKIIPGRATAKTRSAVTGRKAARHEFLIEGRIVSETALTRSEARAAVKRRLGLRRLPVGA